MPFRSPSHHETLEPWVPGSPLLTLWEGLDYFEKDLRRKLPVDQVMSRLLRVVPVVDTAISRMMKEEIP